MRLYFGVVSVLVDGHLYNEFAHGVCESEGDFLGRLTRRATENRPGGRITNSAVYPVDDESVLDAAWEMGRDRAARGPHPFSVSVLIEDAEEKAVAAERERCAELGAALELAVETWQLLFDVPVPERVLAARDTIREGAERKGGAG